MADARLYNFAAFKARRDDRLSALAVLNSKRAVTLSRMALAETPEEQRELCRKLGRIERLRSRYLAEKRAVEGGRG